MEILFEGQYMNEALLERVNPVYKTARSTSLGLAGTNDADAIALVEKLNISDSEAWNSARASASDQNVLVGEITIETRYSTISRLALQSGAALVVDLPCGLTPRGIQFAREGQRYLGLDLPATILEGESAFLSLVDEDKKQLVRYEACDATNYESLKKALAGTEGEVCICTEGLLMYLTESETNALCENIRAVLQERGGCWLNSDPEVAIQYGLTIRTLFPQLMEKIYANGKKNVEDKAEIRMSPTDLLVMPAGDVAEGMKKAMAFLAKHGLKAERINVGENLGDLRVFAKIEADDVERYKEAMKKVGFWKITLADKAVGEETTVEGKDFAAHMHREGADLKVKLIGRVDTLTAPSLLSLYEDEKSKAEVGQVLVDCSDLDYISSAGLRVLLIMHKSAEGGVTLRGVSKPVLEILEQTGFDSIVAFE
ncbi:MAG: STAS domain-containing protein [Coriobacteriales bacterium]|nr:STAS domain-containing protein [Coriobacteriales bacterium]